MVVVQHRCVLASIFSCIKHREVNVDGFNLFGCDGGLGLLGHFDERLQVGALDEVSEAVLDRGFVNFFLLRT
jgi:hypothetical protein